MSVEAVTVAGFLPGRANLEPGAALFQGQGCQVPGSYRGLYDTNSVFRSRIDRADQICRPHGFTVSELWYGDRQNELVGDTADTTMIQPALTAIESGIYSVLEANNVSAKRMHLGHSLGQIPAAIASKAISFDTGMKLSIVRGRVMGEFEKAQDTAVGLIRDAKEQYGDLYDRVRGYLEDVNVQSEFPQTYITVLNHKFQLVVGGPLAQVRKLLQSIRDVLPEIKVSNLRNVPLSHSPILQSGQDEYNREMEKVLAEEQEVPQMEIPLVSDVLGHLMEATHEYRESARIQLTRMVNWKANMEYMVGQGVREVLEIGPKQIFAEMIKTVNPDVRVFSTDSEESIEAVLSRYGRGRMNFAAASLR